MDEEIINRKNPSELLGVTSDCLCCSPLKSEMKSFIWKLLQDGDFENQSQFNQQTPSQLDYLLVETSGVTDPHSIVTMLEEKFGQMTRARLDCVVAVVDADYLLGFISSNQTSSIPLSYISQVSKADVIIMNKMDLIEEGEELVREWIVQMNPRAFVSTSVFGRVPLHQILDLEEMEDESGEHCISHDVLHSFDIFIDPRINFFCL